MLLKGMAQFWKGENVEYTQLGKWMLLFTSSEKLILQPVLLMDCSCVVAQSARSGLIPRDVVLSYSHFSPAIVLISAENLSV